MKDCARNRETGRFHLPDFICVIKVESHIYIVYFIMSILDIIFSSLSNSRNLSFVAIYLQMTKTILSKI